MSKDAGLVDCGYIHICIQTYIYIHLHVAETRAFPGQPKPASPEPYPWHSTSARAIRSAESRSGCWNRRPAGFSTSLVPMREYKAVLEMEISVG